MHIYIYRFKHTVQILTNDYNHYKKDTEQF